MKRGSVLTHVTDLNDEADKESAPNGEQNESHPYLLTFFAASWM